MNTGDNPQPDRIAAARLIDLATQRGFRFSPADERGSLWGVRVSARWQDVVFLGASGHANAARTSATQTGRGIQERVTGTALSVLNTVLNTWPT